MVRVRISGNERQAVRGINSGALALLADDCMKLAEHHPEIAEEAMSLHTEWAALVAKSTPAPIHLREADLINAQARALAARMFEFLKANS